MRKFEIILVFFNTVPLEEDIVVNRYFNENYKTRTSVREII